MNAYEALVREFADEGPFLDRSAILREDVCMTCEMSEEGIGEDNEDPQYHELSCLWRRALELTRPG